MIVIEMRTVNVSERVYGILKYGSEVYGKSMGVFLEMLLDAFVDKLNAKELITRLESQISQNTRLFQSEGLGMIKEALSLIAEFDPAKAKELEERLTEIKSQNTYLE